MELQESLIACSAVFFLSIVFAVFFFKNQRNLPPGPFAWPVVGSLFSVTLPLHKHFAKLSTKYGPVIYLKIGTVPYLIICDSTSAREVLVDRDQDFFYRPEANHYKLFSLGYNNMSLTPPGESWKKLRKVAKNNIFSPSSINRTARYRSDAMKETLKSILQTCDAGGTISMRHSGAEFIEVANGLVLFGERNNAVVPLAKKALALIATEVNIAEVLPVLAPLDLSGVDRKLEVVMSKVKSLLQEQLDKHRERKERTIASNELFECQDFVDVLISMEGEDALPDICIMGVLVDMVAGGVDTSRVAIEWAMGELANNPDLQRKAQEELDTVIGKDRLIQEADLSKLPYMQAIVKETLRLHPPGPLGGVHSNKREAEVAGYRIPANCRVLINIWAIGRSNKWKEPETFKPERFLNSEITFTDRSFEFVPFGGGRRICIGMPLATQMVAYGIASMLQAFSWSPPPGKTSMDLTEKPSLVSEPATDVTLVAVPRLNRSVYYA